MIAHLTRCTRLHREQYTLCLRSYLLTSADKDSALLLPAVDSDCDRKMPMSSSGRVHTQSSRVSVVRHQQEKYSTGSAARAIPWNLLSFAIDVITNCYCFARAAILWLIVYNSINLQRTLRIVLNFMNIVTGTSLVTEKCTSRQFRGGLY